MSWRHCELSSCLCSDDGFPVWPEGSGRPHVHRHVAGLLSGCCLCSDPQVPSARPSIRQTRPATLKALFTVTMANVNTSRQNNPEYVVWFLKVPSGATQRRLWDGHSTGGAWNGFLQRGYFTAACGALRRQKSVRAFVRGAVSSVWMCGQRLHLCAGWAAPTAQWEVDRIVSPWWRGRLSPSFPPGVLLCAFSMVAVHSGPQTWSLSVLGVILAVCLVLTLVVWRQPQSKARLVFKVHRRLSQCLQHTDWKRARKFKESYGTKKKKNPNLKQICLELQKHKSL